jgi:hypothetical protein
MVWFVDCFGLACLFWFLFGPTRIANDDYSRAKVVPFTVKSAKNDFWSWMLPTYFALRRNSSIDDSHNASFCSVTSRNN